MESWNFLIWSFYLSPFLWILSALSFFFRYEDRSLNAGSPPSLVISTPRVPIQWQADICHICVSALCLTFEFWHGMSKLQRGLSTRSSEHSMFQSESSLPRPLLLQRTSLRNVLQVLTYFIFFSFWSMFVCSRIYWLINWLALNYIFPAVKEKALHFIISLEKLPV